LFFLLALAQGSGGFYNGNGNQPKTANCEAQPVGHYFAQGQRKCMKWSQYGRTTLALVASLALGLSITACNPTFTLGYVYVLTTATNPGLINAYTIDSASGAITQVANSPFPSGGQYPIAGVVDNQNKWLYVIHEIDNTVVEFAIGIDGKLYQQHTYNTPGTYPIAEAIDPSSKYLFVVDSYDPTYITGVAPRNINPIASNTGPTQGCVVVYPITPADGSLGAPVPDPTTGQSCFPIGAAPALGSQPISITATTSVDYLYVADQGTHTVFAYSVNYSNGVLTPLPAANNSFQAGVEPSAILSSPNGHFVYVTDQSANDMLGYTVQSNGALLPMGQPIPTDLYPNNMAMDPTGQYLYETNFNSNDVGVYSINATTGTPTAISSGSNYGTGTGPTCIVMEPAYGRFLYVSNFLSSSASGFQVDPQNGSLVQVLNTPKPTNGEPSCVAAASNRTHPVSSTATP
jgi:6-phosphogluconolactonase (cycloisomerase 2 family)